MDTAFQFPGATGAERAEAAIAKLTANGTTTGDNARSRGLVLSGTGGTLNIPVQAKVYLVVNNCTGTVTLTCGVGTSAVEMDICEPCDWDVEAFSSTYLGRPVWEFNTN